MMRRKLHNGQASLVKMLAVAVLLLPYQLVHAFLRIEIPFHGTIARNQRKRDEQTLWPSTFDGHMEAGRARKERTVKTSLEQTEFTPGNTRRRETALYIVNKADESEDKMRDRQASTDTEENDITVGREVMDNNMSTRAKEIKKENNGKEEGINKKEISIAPSTTSNNDGELIVETSTKKTSANKNKASRLIKPPKVKTVSVLLCPAQFCVPADYDDLIRNLEDFFEDESKEHEFQLGSLKVVPLPRTEWIKVAKSLPTQDYLNGTLKGRNTLSWYYQAIEDAIAEILQEQGDNILDMDSSGEYASEDHSHSICIIGHSIGGWVARGWMGGLGYTSTAIHKRALERVSSFITIGTPHASPPDALVDQTRGLLAEVASCPECSSDYMVNDANISVTTVCSGSIESRLLTTDIKSLLGVFSYIPQAGIEKGLKTKGDGIVPLTLGLMEEPANRIVVETSTSSLDGSTSPIWHAHVLPTPWNLIDPTSPSLKLPEDVLWYGSREVLREWAPYIQ